MRATALMLVTLPSRKARKRNCRKAAKDSRHHGDDVGVWKKISAYHRGMMGRMHTPNIEK